MASIDSRLAALAEAIERKRMEEEAPVDELSRSLYNMCTGQAHGKGEPRYVLSISSQWEKLTENTIKNF